MKARLLAQLRVIAPVFPFGLFLLFAFVVPISYMLLYSVHTPQVKQNFPQFYEALHRSESVVPMDDSVYSALAHDVIRSRQDQTYLKTLKRFRQQDISVWRLLKKTARQLKDPHSHYTRDWFIGVDGKWAEESTWRNIRVISQSISPFYLANAMDFRYSGAGFQLKNKNQRIYIRIILNTFMISLTVTVAAFLLAYPVAYLLANISDRKANLLMILVLLPFWTSLLVRTFAWIILLQKNGVINYILQKIGLISDPLPLMFNRFGVCVVMTQILLPFMILSIYSVMKSVPSIYTKAASSLGAPPVHQFFKVYFPMTLPGVSAGSLLVFILSLGYFITPALVGGAKDTMISMLISDNMSLLMNWGMASALGTMLLVITIGVLFLFRLGFNFKQLNISQ